MIKQALSENQKELNVLCNKIRALTGMGDYRKCESLIISAMGKYPHAPEPHNLLGVLLEKEGDHPAAMKHFRAAWALNPTYMPARQNLDNFGTFFSRSRYAYDESDCPAEEKNNNYKTEYDDQGVGHVRRI